jgi:ribosome-binding protein aMBF1 (putative translation factor)
MSSQTLRSTETEHKADGDQPSDQSRATATYTYLYRQLYTLDQAILGRRIERARLEQDISTEELSRAAYCDPSELVEIEAGRKRPIMPVVRGIAARLGRPIEELLRDAEPGEETAGPTQAQS